MAMRPWQRAGVVQRRRQVGKRKLGFRVVIGLGFVGLGPVTEERARLVRIEFGSENWALAGPVLMRLGLELGFVAS